MLTIAFFSILAIGVTHSMAHSMVGIMPPEKILGWKVHGKVETYNRETIFDYMNGAGEIYLAYDFRELSVQRYIKPKSPDIVLEIFDMGSSEDAFGVFSHGQGREEGLKVKQFKGSKVGQDSEYSRGLLCFWKDRFFVSIYAERETLQAKKAVLALGNVISKRIKTEGKKPSLLNYLPEDKFSEKSLRYFHRHEILNYHYFVADKNILHLDRHTNALFVQYRDDKGYLLLVEYREPNQAKKAHENFTDAYMPEAKHRGIVQIENGRWVAVRLEKNFMIVVFDAISEAEAFSKIEAVWSKLR
jgi:hypothetical protein